MTTRNVKWYGWKPDLPDHRDFKFKRPMLSFFKSLPSSVSLRSKMPAVFDQGELGSCTANATAGAMAFLKHGFIGSRLQIYYDSRKFENDVTEDAGAQIRDVITVLNKTGAAPESLWPYIVNKFAVAPPANVEAEAAKETITKYIRLDPKDYRRCLADGFPFVIGITMYDGFESDYTARTGRVQLPTQFEQVVGGHAVCVIGYAVKWGELHYEVRNSWGSDWGDYGNFWIPAKYLENTDLADDAWTIRAEK